MYSDFEIDFSSFKTFYIWTEDIERAVDIIVYPTKSKTALIPFISELPEIYSDSYSTNLTLNICNEIESFTIGFECIDDSYTTVNLEVHDIENEKTHKFKFSKRCMTGIRDDIMIYYGEDIVVDNGETVKD